MTIRPLPRWTAASIPGLASFFDKFAGTLEQLLSNGAQNGVTAAPAGQAGGALKGTYPNPALAPSFLEIGTYTGGIVLTNSQRVLRFTFSVPATLSANWSGNATSDIATTNSALFTIKSALAASPNTFTTIGNLTFAASGNTGTFSSTVAHSFAIGDVMVIDGPITADPTLAGVSITILALS